MGGKQKEFFSFIVTCFVDTFGYPCEVSLYRCHGECKLAAFTVGVPAKSTKNSHIPLKFIFSSKPVLCLSVIEMDHNLKITYG